MNNLIDETIYGMEKRVSIGPQSFIEDGESRVVPLVKAASGLLEVDDRMSRGHVKIAASQEAIDALNQIEPEAGRVYCLVVALGAREHWGDNNNGDGFPIAGLLNSMPEWTRKPVTDRQRDQYEQYRGRVKPVFGHRTFVTNAHTFYEHENQKPALKIGDIHGSFWNDPMKRVENIISVIEEGLKDTVLIARARRIAAKIRNGESLATSMACRVPFDRCSICGNLAPTRKQYCQHLLTKLRQVMEDGRSIAMINDFPVFFDESIVETPAAPEALMIMKMAYILNPYDAAAQAADPGDGVKQASEAKAALHRKESQINKEVEPLPDDINQDNLERVGLGLYAQESDLPEPVLTRLSKHAAEDVVLAMESLGMMLRPSEFFKMAGFNLPVQTATRVMSASPYTYYESPDAMVTDLPYLFTAKTAGIIELEQIASLLKPFMAERSYAAPYLEPRLMKLAMLDEDQFPFLPTGALDEAEKMASACYYDFLRTIQADGAYSLKVASMASTWAHLTDFSKSPILNAGKATTDAVKNVGQNSRNLLAGTTKWTEKAIAKNSIAAGAGLLGTVGLGHQADLKDPEEWNALEATAKTNPIITTGMGFLAARALHKGLFR